MKLPSYIPEVADKKYRWISLSCHTVIHKITIFNIDQRIQSLSVSVEK